MMKSPENVLRNAIISDASVTSLVGHRVYPHVAPSADLIPLIVWRRSTVSREQTLGLPMGVPRVTIEYQIFAATYYEARQIADAVRDVLDGYGGFFDNTEVRQVSLESESDDIIALDGGETPSAYSVTQDYDVWWQET